MLEDGSAARGKAVAGQYIFLFFFLSKISLLLLLFDAGLAQHPSNEMCHQMQDLLHYDKSCVREVLVLTTSSAKGGQAQPRQGGMCHIFAPSSMGLQPAGGYDCAALDRLSMLLYHCSPSPTFLSLQPPRWVSCEADDQYTSVSFLIKSSLSSAFGRPTAQLMQHKVAVLIAPVVRLGISAPPAGSQGTAPAAEKPSLWRTLQPQCLSFALKHEGVHPLKKKKSTRHWPI